MKQNNNTTIIVLVFAFMFAVFFVTLTIFAFALPTVYDLTFLGELKYKIERLQTAEGKRIIVIGGSAVAFGQDSALMESYLTDYTVVNFGLYGDLGTKTMLDIAEKELRNGDIVVISPEQDARSLSLQFDGEIFWQAADGNFNVLLDAKIENISSLIGCFPQFAARKAYYNFLDEKPNPTDIYRMDAFNAYGDVDKNLRPYNVMAEGYDTNRPVNFDYSIIGEGFIDYLNEFNKKATSRGATVYYRLCPVNALSVSDNSSEEIDEFFEALEQRLDFSVIGNPHNSVIAAGYFYDTNFHLNDSGIVLNTYNMICDLKIELRDTSATDIALPSVPVVPAISHEGDNSDADCFLYQETGGGLTIVGLTDVGKGRTSIVVPVTYNEKTVIGFSAETFKNNENIVQLTLQSNIRSIQDYSFEGCVNFEKLILLGLPSDCAVGDNLFGSAQFGVYVPQELLNNYKTTSYFWSVYANRIYPLEVNSGS